MGEEITPEKDELLYRRLQQAQQATAEQTVIHCPEDKRIYVLSDAVVVAAQKPPVWLRVQLEHGRADTGESARLLTEVPSQTDAGSTPAPSVTAAPAPNPESPVVEGLKDG